ncbi:unnamed protein product [Heterobilharzia americana]|nr:unnamed protein product [Heterobilharzia americana]
MIWIISQLYFILISFYLNTSIRSDNEVFPPGGRFDIQINYTNEQSTVRNGDVCDLQINYCDVFIKFEMYALIGKNSRSLFRKTTDTKSDTLTYQAYISQEINESLHELYRLELHVYDEDVFDAHDLITYASGLYQPNTMSTFQRIPLHYKHPSTSFSLSVSIRLKCNPNYYGIKCNVYCFPHSWAYKCNTDGTKLCTAGRYGANCDYVDFCKIYPCPKNTRCKNLPGENRRKCICKNYEGAECHSFYYSCDRSPCKNGGQCTLLRDFIENDNTGVLVNNVQNIDDVPENTDDETICICPDNWTGQFCTKPVVDCIVENEKHELSDTRRTNRFCLNGGVCINHSSNASARCSCPPEWDGYFCELSKGWSVGKAFGVVFTVVIAIFLILFIGFFVWLYFLSKRSHIQRRYEITYPSEYQYNDMNVNKKINGNMRVYTKPKTTLCTANDERSPTGLRTFGKAINSEVNPLKVQNDYEILYTTEGINNSNDNSDFISKNEETDFHKTLETFPPRDGSYDDDESIYVNCNSLILGRKQNNSSSDLN